MSLTHAPGQNRLSFNSPSKAAVVLTGAGMAFIRHPSRAGTLSPGVVSALSKRPPTLSYVENQILCSGRDCVSAFLVCVSPCLHLGVYFIARMSQTLWDSGDAGVAADRIRTTGKRLINLSNGCDPLFKHYTEPSICLAGCWGGGFLQQPLKLLDWKVNFVRC